MPGSGRSTTPIPFVALLAVCSALGFGWGGGAQLHSSTAARASESEGRQAANADELAYVELARASGTLRTNAAAAALGRARRIADHLAISGQVKAVLNARPRDALLRTAQRETEHALKAAPAANPDRHAPHPVGVAA